ncbi:MAG: DUF551 domain-containing protein, partial [Chitinophagaceae bacterium]|nr:DUF551 domain-containing protein [Chitinophagaceae bacterium]
LTPEQILKKHHILVEPQDMFLFAAAMEEYAALCPVPEAENALDDLGSGDFAFHIWKNSSGKHSLYDAWQAGIKAFQSQPEKPAGGEVEFETGDPFDDLRIKYSDKIGKGERKGRPDFGTRWNQLCYEIGADLKWLQSQQSQAPSAGVSNLELARFRDHWYNLLENGGMSVVGLSMYVKKLFRGLDDMISALPPSGEQLKEGEKQWIPVETALPEYGVKVLVLGELMGINPQMGGAYVSIGYRSDLTKTALEKQADRHQDKCQFSRMSYTTHWMPLPAPPSLPNDLK